MSTTVNINNNILTWAIHRAGFDVHSFTSKYPNVKKWIDGEKQPTIKQLEEFSKKVFLPFGYLFLTDPPQEKINFPFFRTRNDSDKISLNVYDTILLLEQRQHWLRDYLQENDFKKLPFVGRFENSTDVNQIVQNIRAELNLEENWTENSHNWEGTLNELVSVIENKGIITVFNGVVANNTRRNIAVEECRGFVLVDDYAPFMFVNNADFKSAQLFTIIHELAHIFIGKSAGFDFRKLQPADNPVEKVCDQVAAEFLVPENIFHARWNQNTDIKYLARKFKVSEIVIARRALDTHKWTKKQFFAFYESYKIRETNRKMQQGDGGDFYATAKKRLSLTFAAHVKQAVKSGQLLYRDAYKLTNLKGDTFEKFFTEYL